MYDFLKNYAERNGESITLRVLRFIRQKDSTSQTDIVKSLGLSKAAVSDAVQKLFNGGYIQENGMLDASRKGGRRRIILKFNPLSGFVIGINFKISSAYLALSDLSGNIYKKKTVRFERGASPDKVIPLIIKAADGLLKLKPDSAGELVGIGIGVPGIIHYGTGKLIYADTLKNWEGVNVGAELEAHFNVPTYIENDVKAGTLAEYLFGIAKGVSNFVLLWIGNGIGAGIIVDGRLMRGANSSAGEIGYNNLGFFISNKRQLPLLYSGQKDFGDILSEDSIVSAYNKARGLNDGKVLTIKDSHKLLDKNDEIAVNIFKEIGRLVGVIGIMLANTLNPELIVLGGDVINGNDQIVEEVYRFLKQDILSAPVENVKLALMRKKSDMALLGAISLILYELFEPQFYSAGTLMKNNN